MPDKDNDPLIEKDKGKDKGDYPQAHTDDELQNPGAGSSDPDMDEDFNEDIFSEDELVREPGGNKGYGGDKIVTGADDEVQVSGENLENFGTSESDNGASGDMANRGRGQTFGYGDQGYNSGGFQGDNGNRRGGQGTGYGGGFGNQGKQPASGKSGNNGRGESSGYDSGGFKKGESDGGFADGTKEKDS